MKVTHLLISGFVQGIGFRKFVKDNARKLGLVGWVRNTPEGFVETEIAGSEDKIEELIKHCKKGPFLADVKSIEVDIEEKDFPFISFEVRHDLN